MRNVSMCFVVIFLSTAQAMAACRTPTDDFNGLRCLSEIYKDSDITLNKSYTNLISSLNMKGQQVARESQLSWIRLRDGQCGYRQSYQFLFDMDCAIKITQERDVYLRALQSECKGPDCFYSDPDMARRIDIKTAFLTGFLSTIKSKDVKRFMQHMNKEYLEEQFYGFLKGDFEYFINSFLWGRNTLDNSYTNIAIDSIEKIEITSYEVNKDNPLEFNVKVLVFWRGGQSECKFGMLQDPDSGIFSIVGNYG
ncbi:MAG: lysozyme inhibitor LprI family protein [Pseudomonas sp.]|uniref:lysozyme inhibitor LprI family protein n=1 Tax=Pseudomonas sp. TaxID=306 RepID=UPI002727654F|nr:lysozyme inhibitor LprI family protein [Pseudomonas sp.]MDO9618121.1 lysozyme inhibitor LprI family protein [Pseudomonas sp.]MDP2447868.1 lysozyme inhibitor LprI family protein [Pseudomonas sp.]MDZ4317215.1 lysozyme inhibitor LprI family protein [Azonexus sp.]